MRDTGDPGKGVPAQAESRGVYMAQCPTEGFQNPNRIRDAASVDIGVKPGSSLTGITLIKWSHWTLSAMKKLQNSEQFNRKQRKLQHNYIPVGDIEPESNYEETSDNSI